MHTTVLKIGNSTSVILPKLSAGQIISTRRSLLLDRGDFVQDGLF
jgi:antitoxin component of MazEF toxin-antitoxin module